MMRNPAGSQVRFSLEVQGGTTTIRTTPAGTTFFITGFSLTGLDIGGGGADCSLEVNGVTIWAGSFANPSGSGDSSIVSFVKLNAVHVGDGIEIIRFVGGSMDRYSLTLYGYDVT